jgi:glucosamine kinase
MEYGARVTAERRRGVLLSRAIVVGVDAGATTTRCVVATTEGVVLARGEAGGANQNSSAGRPADALTAALRAALSEVDIGRVGLGVVGSAGGGPAGRSEARDATEAAWRAVGLPGTVRSATDLEVAFAAGTSTGTGLLLLAGTGAAAVAFRHFVPSHRSDGYGWLLGDEGSAVWIGREALRSVLATLDGRRRAPTTLIRAVTDLFGVEASDDPDTHAQRLMRVAYRQPPAALGQLAPLVNDAATRGDPLAVSIVDAAAEHLLNTFEAVVRRGGTSGSPTVVLAGSVLLSPGPVADRVRAGLAERFGVTPMAAHDGAAGAAARAIAHLTGQPIDDAVHARLCEPR